MRVETLAVGTELLLGQIVNGNAATIGGRLAEAGLDHFRQTVVGDNVERIAEAIRLATARSDALIITGGIGPTLDDLTRDAMCAAAGVEMLFSDDYAEQLRQRWEARGRVMPESNLRQAHYPAGAEMIPNAKGTAPGLKMMIDGCWVFAVPGVPQEMVTLVDEVIVPFLRAEAGDSGVVVSRLLRSWGESESKVGEMLADLYDDHTNPTVAFLASSGEIKVRLTAKAGSATEAEELIAPLEAEVRSRLGRRIFGADGDVIETVLFRLLGERGWTIGTAESATGGLIAGRLTAIAGSSAHFVGGVVAYTAGLKQRLLDVPAGVIEEHGLVSEEVAIAMADGGATRLGADVVIAVTGSAGPDALEQKPGTMVIAVRTPEETVARTVYMPGDRERVRVYTSTAALHIARLAVLGAAGEADISHWVRRGASSRK